MPDFFNINDDKNNKKTNAILSAFLKGLGNLFNKTFAFNSKDGKPTLFGFIPKILGAFFQMFKTFAHSLFDHSKDPAVKEMFEKTIDPVCDRGINATKRAEKEGFSGFFKGITENAPDGDMLTLFSNFFTPSSSCSKNNAPEQNEPKPSSNRPRPKQ